GVGGGTGDWGEEEGDPAGATRPTWITAERAASSRRLGRSRAPVADFPRRLPTANASRSGRRVLRARPGTDASRAVCVVRLAARGPLIYSGPCESGPWK